MITDLLTGAYRGLLMWDRRRVLVAVLAALGSAVVIGLATVLIPNAVFARDIPPEWWDYPVWILVSALLGMLIATYLREGASASQAGGGADESDGPATQRRSGVVGSVGGMLGWFAVGCPVCNKIALLILGYTGALTYFAPLQPILAALSVILLLVAVVVRLKGQYSCPIPARERKLPS